MNETRRNSLDALDALFILSLSIFLLLVVLWLATLLAGGSTLDHLPGWLSSSTHRVWTFLISGASPLIIYFFKRSRQDNPNYILWVMGTTTCLVAIVVGLRYGLTPPQPPSDLDLHMELLWEGAPKTLRLSQAEPLAQPRNIIVQQSGRYEIRLPGTIESFRAFARPSVLEGRRSTPSPTDLSVCFSLKTKPTSNTHGVWIRYPKRWDPEFNVVTGEELIEPCEVSPQALFPANPVPGLLGWILGTAHADHHEGLIWTVPSLETLRAERESGFTAFRIEIDPDPAWMGVDRYTVTLLVNGTRARVDGFSPERLQIPYNPYNPLVYEFGMENLGFSGEQKGWEDIQVSFALLSGKQHAAAVSCQLDYVALRTFEERSDTTDSRHPFTWRADYIPSGLNEFEVFMRSTPDSEEASQIKRRVDRGNYAFDGRAVVGVIRPPLRENPNYGVILGMIEETGQIDFAFKFEKANRVLDWAKALNAENPVFRRDAYLYPLDERQVQ